MAKHVSEQDVDAKILKTLATEKYDALLAASWDNLTYLTRTVLPFAPNFPDKKAIAIITKKGGGCIICPHDWGEAVLDQGWKRAVFTYREGSGTEHEYLITSLKSFLKRHHVQNVRIGWDSAGLPARMAESLRESFPSVHWCSSDSLFRELRIVKSKREIQLLETASRHSEIGIIGALQHMEGSLDGTGYTLAEFSERVRVHVYEAGGSGVGLMAAMTGPEGRDWYRPPRGKFRKGDLVRVEVTNHFQGYWSNACRMAVIGQPSDKQRKSYEENLQLKRAAEELLRPGVCCRELYERVVQVAKREKIDYCPHFGMGQGVGTNEREAPYFGQNDDTILRPGMVAVISIYSYGPQRELVCSKDTYEIGPKAPRLLSWYKNWDRLYPVTGFRSAH